MNELHEKFQSVMKRVVDDNPQYLIVYSNAIDREALIRHYFPEYLEIYHAIVPGAFKSDIWRLLMLYKYGGIYNDISIRYDRNISSIIRPSDEFVGVVDMDPTAIINGFMAAYPRHPIIKAMIDLVISNIENARYGCNNLDITGPKALGRAFRMFFGEFRSSPIRVGDYKLGKYNLRFLKFTGGTPMQSILLDSTVVIRNKFEGSPQLLYRNGSLSFGIMYYYHTVFKCENSDTSTTRSKPTGTCAADSHSYLYKEGKEFMYVSRDIKWRFPDYYTFTDLGFEDCMAFNERRSGKDVESFEVKMLPSGQVQDTLQLLHLLPKHNSSEPSNYNPQHHCRATHSGHVLSLLQRLKCSGRLNFKYILDGIKAYNYSLNVLPRTITYRKFEDIMEHPKQVLFKHNGSLFVYDGSKTAVVPDKATVNVLVLHFPVLSNNLIGSDNLLNELLKANSFSNMQSLLVKPVSNSVRFWKTMRRRLRCWCRQQQPTSLITGPITISP